MRAFRRRGLTLAGGTLTAALAATVAFAAPAGTGRGPNSATDPYVVPMADGVSTKALLTVDDAESADNGYEMVGIPDGLGAADIKGTRDFNLYMNQELRQEQGVTRRHGQTGAFVSKYEIDPRTFAVEEGSDLIDPPNQGSRYYDYVTQTYGPTPSTGGPNPRVPGDVFPAQTAQYQRFCSNNLTELGQLYNDRTGRGYKGRVFFPNEESGNEGRAFGTLENGETRQLPRLGLFSWENTLAAFNRSDTTVVMGNEDAATGQMWAYLGKKQKSGNAFEKAGLDNGKNTVVDLLDEGVSTDSQFRSTYEKGEPARFDLDEVNWDQSGNKQNSDAQAKGLTLNRIEDGAFDPDNRNDYYFLTTEGGNGSPPNPPGTGEFGRDGGGLWKMSFKDIERPERGGTLTLLLDGSEQPLLNKPDNLTIDDDGHLLIQEDPGRNVSIARIVGYDLDSLTDKKSQFDHAVLARFDPALFGNTAPSGQPPVATKTIDEESSGIIPADDVLGKGWFLFDAQVHKASPNPASVEEGQLLAMKVKDLDKVLGGREDDDDDDDDRDD